MKSTLSSICSVVVAVAFCVAANSVAFGKTCDLAIEGNDAMQYNVKELNVAKDCTEIKVTLKHTGKLPKAAMGHNWILSTEKDKQAIIDAGIKAGLDKDYVPAGDSKIVAHTKVVGGGETATTSFKMSALKKGESYLYFCSFPGHAALMTGKLIVK